VKVPTVVRWLGLVALVLLLVVLAVPLWLPLLGTSLAVADEPQPADAALVLEGTGRSALDIADGWRRAGLVRDVVIVEAPVRTHALEAYWSDFVAWGLAEPAPTPADARAVVRAPSTQTGQQAQAARPALAARGARTVLVPGGGGIGSRLVARDLEAVLGPAGITARLVRVGDGRPAARWYQNADDRRAVLDSWLQLLVPGLSGYDAAATGSYTT
jgi:hypothetical protein